MFRSVLIASFLLISFSASAQNYSHKKKFGTQKNAMYFYWGYNRSMYSKSNIQFSSPDYNFTVLDAEAHDRPSRDIMTYINPATISIPQFNVRIGWYYKHRWDISVGYDHMKYVMADDQTLYIEGYINGTVNSELSGIYNVNTGKIPIRSQDLHYENTNGLNYISLQLNNTAPLYKTNNRKFAIQRRFGGGFGPVVTQTDFTWDSEQYSSGFKVAGWGLSLNGGVRFDFFNRFFLLSNWSAGYISLPKNETIQYRDHYAKQQFVFGQWEIVGGVLWYLRTKNACDSCPDW